MGNFSRLRRLLRDDDLAALDNYLQRTLTPVFPSRRFVQELQTRLLTDSFDPGGLRNLRLFQFMLVSTGVLAGVSLLVIAGIRVLIGVFTLIGMIQTFSKQGET